jgi:hypothetical protein
MNFVIKKKHISYSKVIEYITFNNIIKINLKSWCDVIVINFMSKMIRNNDISC